MLVPGRSLQRLSQKYSCPLSTLLGQLEALIQPSVYSLQPLESVSILNVAVGWSDAILCVHSRVGHTCSRTL